MIRGTTPKLKFTLPFDSADLSVCYITLAQKDSVVVEKTLEDCERNGRELSVRLTQAETLKLDANHSTKIQIRAKTAMSDAIASDIFTVCTEDILKDGEI